VSPGPDPRVDVVVVAYNSVPTLAACVGPLAGSAQTHVVVVDNDSPDDTAGALAGLDVTYVRAPSNGGFASGSNIGIAAGSAPYVLLLNPDARLAAADLEVLARVLDDDGSVGLVAPRVFDAEGATAFSQRRLPRRRSTFAQALFLHRIWPTAPWTDELVRDARAYEHAGSPEWVVGACMLTRRSLLEQLGGLDESFFLYCEDTDLCARTRDAGYDVRYEPAAAAFHVGGASAPRDGLLAVRARARVAYAFKHDGRAAACLEAVGVALGHLTHAAACVFRPAAFRGHVRALAATVSPPAPWRGP